MRLVPHCVLLMTLFIGAPACAQLNPALRQELLEMRELDQRRGTLRALEEQHGHTSAEYNAALEEQRAIDAANLQRLDQIVTEFGWPTISLVGAGGAESAFLIVQHALLDGQKRYLPYLEAAVRDGEARGKHLAMLQDRILMWEGKKNIYGTQLRRNDDTGEWFLWPIENEGEVDARRAAIGMVPLAEELASYPFPVTPMPEGFELTPFTP